MGNPLDNPGQLEAVEGEISHQHQWVNARMDKIRTGLVCIIIHT